MWCDTRRGKDTNRSAQVGRSRGEDGVIRARAEAVVLSSEWWSGETLTEWREEREVGGLPVPPPVHFLRAGA